jgi:hypothetical protein
MSYSEKVGKYTVPGVAPRSPFRVPSVPVAQYGVPSQASNGQYVKLNRDDIAAARFLAENKRKGGRRTRLNRRSKRTRQSRKSRRR